MSVMIRNVMAVALVLGLLLGGAASGADSKEDMFWQSVKKSDVLDEYRVYVEQYPNGKHIGEAWRRIGQLEAGEKSALAARREAEARRQAEEEAARREDERRRAEADTLRPGRVFKDCAECPEMVVIPAGSFEMGSPSSELGRVDKEDQGNLRKEGPQHRVSVQVFALAVTEVTVDQFRKFIQATGYHTDAEKEPSKGCYLWQKGWIGSGWDWRNGRHWDDTGFRQTGTQPVTCISWNDAIAYATWLAKQAGKPYRLPSEAEWEYAARAGSTTARYWGEDPHQACAYANVADRTMGPGGQGFLFGKHECTDNHWFSAPVASFKPNSFGLYDMLGNVLEWTEDCSNGNYSAAPIDGSAWTSGDCGRRVLRGGYWGSPPQNVRAASRLANEKEFRSGNNGFRPARMIP